MSISKPFRLLGALTVLAGIPLVSALAQTQTPTQSDPASPPPATRPEATPLPPTNPAQKPVIPARPTDKSATAPAPVNPMVGLTVFSADGSKLSTVESVGTG